MSERVRHCRIGEVGKWYPNTRLSNGRWSGMAGAQRAQSGGEVAGLRRDRVTESLGHHFCMFWDMIMYIEEINVRIFNRYSLCFTN